MTAIERRHHAGHGLAAIVLVWHSVLLRRVRHTLVVGRRHHLLLLLVGMHLIVTIRAWLLRFDLLLIVIVLLLLLIASICVDLPISISFLGLVERRTSRLCSIFSGLQGLLLEQGRLHDVRILWLIHLLLIRSRHRLGFATAILLVVRWWLLLSVILLGLLSHLVTLRRHHAHR